MSLSTWFSGKSELSLSRILFFQTKLKLKVYKTIKIGHESRILLEDEYFKFIAFDFKKKYRDQEHANQFIQRTVIPFSIFLSNFIADKKIRKVPKMLREKGLSLFGE